MPTTDLNASILSIIRKDFTTLLQSLTVEQALEQIRRQGMSEQIVYFYAVDDAGRLVGVVPTRKLLMAQPVQTIAEIMNLRLVTIPHMATVMDACEFFVMYKFLAIPVVDADRHILGIAEIGLFTEGVFDMDEREQTDEAFESLGFKISSVRNASSFKAFAIRFPWLLATIGCGTLCAMLTSAFEMTLSKSLVLAFFLTMVLGLAESVSIQSMTLSIQALKGSKPTWRSYRRALRKELRTAALLGLACGLAVGLIVFLWRGDAMAAFVIGSGILMSLNIACLFGLSVPNLLHALKLDPKIAAGPITLALTDSFALLFYFTLAWLVL